MTRIAVLISGSGTTLKNLIDCRLRGELPIDICLVISSKPTAGGLEFAKAAQIPHKIVSRKTCNSTTAFSEAIFELCRNAKVELVVMGGFLAHVLVPSDFEHRVMNIHPSLIPKYCGQGFYGHRVHQAVLAAGESETGCTVHFVDDEYDHGPIILQRAVPVQPGDTVETLQRRVFAVECEALPEAIRLFAAGRIVVQDSTITIRSG